MSSRKRVFCSVAPEVTNPGRDYASPRQRLVKPKVAARLRKRAHRDTKRAKAMGFPWNDACRNRVANINCKPRHWKEVGRLPCGICNAGSSRHCCRAALLAFSLVPTKLASVVRFVRSPGVPVLNLDEPWDQEAFNHIFENLCEQAVADTLPDHVTLHAINRFAAVGAITATPDLLAGLPS